MRFTLVLSLVFAAAFTPGCTSTPSTNGQSLAASAQPTKVSGTARIKEGNIAYDLYLPGGNKPAPVILVAHGFTRRSGHMVGWGHRLSEEGYVVIIPQLPSIFDNRENARVINGIIPWLFANSPHAERMDSRRIGLMGLSAGGLNTLLAAADNPLVKLWVGLDPVDHAGLGLAAAPRYKGASVILRAPPTAWNGNGNALLIEKALPNGCKDILIPDSVHIDAEWPTDIFAELAIGISTEKAREAFARNAVDAINGYFKASQTAELPTAATMPSRTP
jgi:dienelactone hydrolase